MKEELEQKFYNEFPSFFDNKNFWGFECGDGWFDLIYTLCQNIKAELKEGDEVTVGQVKEKFGGLRFYTYLVVDGDSKKIYDLIREAEDKSYSICEVCGGEGKERTNRSWIRTLCDEHNV